MFRIELAENIPSKKPKGIAVRTIKSDWKSLTEFAANKLNIKKKKKQMRLFIGKGSPKLPPGTEIDSKTNLNEVLADGVIIVGSRGENYLVRNATTKQVSDEVGKLPVPPRHPFPGILSEWEPLVAPEVIETQEDDPM